MSGKLRSLRKRRYTRQVGGYCNFEEGWTRDEMCSTALSPGYKGGEHGQGGTAGHKAGAGCMVRWYTEHQESRFVAAAPKLVEQGRRLQ
jgi:hypothetical protein